MVGWDRAAQAEIPSHAIGRDDETQTGALPAIRRVLSATLTVLLTGVAVTAISGLSVLLAFA